MFKNLICCIAKKDGSTIVEDTRKAGFVFGTIAMIGTVLSLSSFGVSIIADKCDGDSND